MHLEQLRTELSQVESDIAAHSFRTDDVLAAHAIIDIASSGDAPPDREAIGAELLAQDLPSLEQLGRTTAKGLYSWGRLHRRQKKLQKKIARRENLRG